MQGFVPDLILAAAACRNVASVEQKFRSPVEFASINRRLKWDLAEAHYFGCSEYRSRSCCCWRCFGITEDDRHHGRVALAGRKFMSNSAQLTADAAEHSAPAKGRTTDASHLYFRDRLWRGGYLGRHRPDVRLFRHLAAGYQHWYDDRHFSDGVSDSELAEPGRRGLKLDELIRVSAAHNSFVGIEHLTDDELEDIRTRCELRAKADRIADKTVERTGKKARQAADRAVD